MKCPGCSEKIHEEELIDGDCPLCGKSIEENDESDYGDTISEIVEFFENQSETMAINIDQKETRERELVLYVAPSILDRVKPKKCDACGRWHLKFGDKEYSVNIRGDRGRIEVNYLCSLCKPSKEGF